MTEDAKEELTLKALGILQEQIEARIIHYKAELETSPELDAVTAQVVQQLQSLQQNAVKERHHRDPKLIEGAHIGTLHKLLVAVFANDTNYTARVIPRLGKRLAKLFFESELHAKTAEQRDKVIHHPEQGVYYVLKRYKHRLRTELTGFDYASDSARKATLDLMNKMERDLQVRFLSRRSPELNQVMTTFTAVLGDFFRSYLPVRLEQMAKLTIRHAKTAEQTNSVPYKIHPERFPMFRAAWEKVLMTQMIHFCGDELLVRLERSESEIRDETVSFFTDPHVYSESCTVICDGLYDRLCLEGFLDLPVDWRVSMTQQA